MGRKPKGIVAMSNAEKQSNYRQREKQKLQRLKEEQRQA